ncbi:MAG: NrfD/PsrC family molybdoenzyme membrane anchor subunit [Steroidobacteraceae bacterium]
MPETSSSALASPSPSEAQVPAGVIPEGWSYRSLTDKIAFIVLYRRSRLPWLVGFGLALLISFAFFSAIGYLLVFGPGIWGLDIPVAWGYAIANYVWWIGMAQGGTFISAVLLLLRQKWRRSINRSAETMTLFAAVMAGLFPILHLGRPWFFYWLAPYPDKMDLWPQWRSPLVWDFFAIAAYLLVSLLFWYAGLLPDLAAMRDRARGHLRQILFGLAALGWRGEAGHWKRHQTAYLMVAALAAPLVVSVHSVVSLDYAIGNTPGYHSTIFPPYFVAGALFSGFAMVLTLAIPLRRFFHLEDFITVSILDNMAKVMFAVDWILIYSYMAETFTGFYSGDKFDIYMTVDRVIGLYGPVYWVLIFCNVFATQILWWRRARRNLTVLFILSLIIQVGMWMERFIITVQPLHRDFLPSAWGVFTPTRWDWIHLFGSCAFFALLFLLFVRMLPAISMHDLREQLHEQHAAGPATPASTAASHAPPPG